MTLTTETLNDFIAGRGFGVAPSAVEAMARELLANREALPVAGECNKEVYENGQSVCLVDIPKETAEVICRGISQATGCKVDWHYIGGRVHIKALAPPAPAMVGELLEAMEEVIRISDRDHDAWNRVKVAITAYRAAMLAQPVSGGYKLVPVEPTENMIIDGFESDAFMALADAVNEKKGWPYGCRESAECVEGIFKAMLAAAPTQGKNNE